jgi:hypothetical protein
VVGSQYEALDLTNGILCYGGQITFSHSLNHPTDKKPCVDVPFIVMFGAHGQRKARGWCCISSGYWQPLGTDDCSASSLKHYNSSDRFSCRYKSDAVRRLRPELCSHWVHVGISRSDVESMPVFSLVVAVCKDNRDLSRSRIYADLQTMEPSTKTSETECISVAAEEILPSEITIAQSQEQKDALVMTTSCTEV